MTLEVTTITSERIAKVMARHGVCSRRDAELMIQERKVAVNGKIIDTPATKVTDQDEIAVNGVVLNKKSTSRLWRFYKPGGVITSHKDPQGRTTLFSLLPDTMPRVVSVGRLDLMSEGLILLTNDGTLARRLELPTNRLKRTYNVRVFGLVDEKKLTALQKGIMIDGIRYGPIFARIMTQQNTNCWLSVTIHEGKNRELRNIFTHLGYRVNRLIRVAYGPFDLDRLQPGELAEVPSEVLHSYSQNNLI